VISDQKPKSFGIQTHPKSKLIRSPNSSGVQYLSWTSKPSKVQTHPKSKLIRSPRFILDVKTVRRPKSSGVQYLSWTNFSRIINRTLTEYYIAFPDLVKYYSNLFTFNPYRGCLGGGISPPGFTWGYSNSTPLGLGVIALYLTQSENAIDKSLSQKIKCLTEVQTLV
jgi:hypothetical protein